MNGKIKAVILKQISNNPTDKECHADKISRDIR